MIMTYLENEQIPVDKECSMCGQHKLLSEFDFLNINKSNDNRTSICKTCQEEKKNADPEICCDG
jgi:hypothetical protein